MFVENPVIAGTMTVMLVLSVFAVLGLFMWKDSHKRKED